MKVTVFAKRIQKKDGTKFTGYVSKLRRHDGTEDYVRVRFNEGTVLPQSFPAIIEVTGANLQTKHITAQDGSEYDRKTLWIKSYTPTGEEYVDHSLDDYE